MRDIGDINFIPSKPDELAGILERRLTESEAISKTRYRTDIQPWTVEGRRHLGLSAEFPIWPLKDNLLDRTKYSIDGPHRPYGYLSGNDGSLFTILREGRKLNFSKRPIQWERETLVFQDSERWFYRRKCSESREVCAEGTTRFSLGVLAVNAPV